MSSQFGHLFRITTFGESHGGGVGVVIDGCPANMSISLERVQLALERRRPGQSHLTTPRSEQDQVICLSGLENGRSLGSPITLYVKNKDARGQDYESLAKTYRPSHADFTTDAKYGIRASSGGGRASARETIGRVAAAAVAEQVIETKFPDFKVVAYVESIKDLSAHVENPAAITREDVDKTPVRCADLAAAEKMEALIVATKKNGDSVGGTIFCGVSGCPAGLGEPIFDKLEADLAKAVMSLPATKGFEIGMGFAATKLFGSEHNDVFTQKQDGTIGTTTNRSGGIQGGISNGEFIYLRAAFKPTATIFKAQQTVDKDGNDMTLKPSGRHDPCVLPRAVPMVEAMVTLVMIDHLLRQQASKL